MIKPVYFPNIYVNEDVIEALKDQFGKICVFGTAVSFPQAETRGADEKNYETIMPDYGDDGRFNDFLLACSSTTPLYDPAGTFQITEELQKRVHDDDTSEDGAEAGAERLMRARLFLQMAHEYDIQSKAIHQELSAFKKKEQELLNRLHGFDDELVPEPSTGEIDKYSSDFRVEKRFESWAVIFEKVMEEEGRSENGFYLTDSRALLETIIEFEPGIEYVCDQPLDLKDKGRLSDFVERLTRCDWQREKETLKRPGVDNKEGGSSLISFCILPDKQPRDLFKKFIAGKNTEESASGQIKINRNIVLACIEI